MVWLDGDIYGAGLGTGGEDRVRCWISEVGFVARLRRGEGEEEGDVHFEG